jgi:hypothetical protein
MTKQELLRTYLFYQNGKLYNRCNRGRAKIGVPVCEHDNGRGYYNFRIGTNSYYVHRAVWEYHNGDIPSGYEIDHIDHNRQNNCLENLRLVTRRENLRNQSLKKRNKTGRIGVFYVSASDAYMATITINRRTINLGTYPTLNEASAARYGAEKVIGFHPNHGT